MGSVSRHSRLFGQRNSQRGDTIVEVMISLIVIATILTGAFLVSRTSSQNIRSSQEHAEALQGLQGQVEMLRSVAGASGNGLTGMSGDFCMKDSGEAVPYSDADCVDQHDGWGYKYVISPPVKQANDNYQFTFTVTWDRLGGGTNQESLVYRLPVAS